MGRLFWKFFIAIWIAQLLGTMSVMFAVDVLHRFEMDNRPQVIDDQTMNRSIESAATVLQQGGPIALRQLMEDTEKHRLIAVDANNRDLLGRGIDHVVLQRAKEKFEQQDGAVSVREIKSADGQSYFLFIDEAGKLTEAPDTRPLPPHGAKLLPTEPLIAHLVASLMVAALLAHYLSRPLRSLQFAFRAIASGNFHVGVADAVESRKDEVADLLREFDRMAAQVRILIDGQRQLFHDVSHEVRSPLARMQVAIGLARQQPEKTGELLDRIDCEIVRIDRLFGELLTLSRLSTIERNVLDEEVCIDEILEDIVESAQFEGGLKGQRFFYPAKSGAIVKGNAELLHRALENVVRNAIKHTDRDGAVHVTAAANPKDDLLKLSITDTGPGVPDAELNSIFESFFRGTKPGQGRNLNGHGLGLAIARRVIEAHRGSIRAYNRSQGGLCVEIAMPILHCAAR